MKAPVMFLQQQFQRISSNLCLFVTFDDKPTGADRWKGDKFACTRELFEAMNIRNAKMRYPSAFLVIDETMHPYCGCIDFKQYKPNKPSKYGLLYKSLCDATIPYTYFSLPHTGKPEIYYITGTDQYSKYLVNGLSARCKMQGMMNISMN